MLCCYYCVCEGFCEFTFEVNKFDCCVRLDEKILIGMPYYVTYVIFLFCVKLMVENIKPNINDFDN